MTGLGIAGIAVLLGFGALLGGTEWASRSDNVAGQVAGFGIMALGAIVLPIGVLLATCAMLGGF